MSHQARMAIGNHVLQLLQMLLKPRAPNITHSRLDAVQNQFLPHEIIMNGRKPLHQLTMAILIRLLFNRQVMKDNVQLLGDQV